MSETSETTTIDEAPPRRLVRVDEGRWLGGVAAGLGRYFDVNPLVYRIAFAALALAGGTGLLLYLAAYLVMPGEHDEDSIAVEALRGHRDHPWLLVGVGLLVFGALFALSEARFWPGTGNLWLTALLVGAALVWWHVSQRGESPRAAAIPEAPPEPESPADPDTETTAVQPPQRQQKQWKPPKKPSLFAPVVGALLAAAGFFGLLAVLDVYDVDLAVALASGVLLVGAAIAFGAMTQRRVGGLVFLGVLLLGAFGIAAVTPVSISAGIGEKNEHPLTPAALDSTYELGMGSLELDLSDLKLPDGAAREVDARAGMGRIVITVPEGFALEIDAHAGAGQVDVLGAQDDGFDAQRTISIPGPTPNAPLLDLEADIAMGDIDVQRG
jgi:phage shock protein PspC (stress-responsive transcriptional regulator)